MEFDLAIIRNSWWRHQMETFSVLLAICAGNSPVPGEFPTQRPVTRSFDVFFDLRLNKRSVNNGEASDLRRYRTHYDVTVMRDRISIKQYSISWNNVCYNPYSPRLNLHHCFFRSAYIPQQSVI